MSENAMWGVAVLHWPRAKCIIHLLNLSASALCATDGLPGAVDELLRAFIMRQNVAMILPITLFVASGFEHCIAICL